MTGRRAIALVAVWTVPSLVFLALTAWFYRTWRLEVPPALPAEARAALTASLRQAFEGGEVVAPAHPLMARRLDGRGPVAATVYYNGLNLGRAEGHGDTLGEATRAAGEKLAVQGAKLTPEQRAATRIKVDVVVARGPLLERHWLLRWFGIEKFADLAALHPGIDGLAVTTTSATGERREHLMMPDELFLRGLLGKKPLTRAIPEVGVGLERARAERLFAGAIAMGPQAWEALERRYQRFRTDAFIEAPARDRPPLPLWRGLPDGPPVTADTLEAAALEGARYLVNHLGANGRYIYEQDLTTGRATDPTRPGPYSLPRHAGTTYFLAEAYRLTGASWLREPIERAFAHLDELISASTCKGTITADTPRGVVPVPAGQAFACVADRGEKRPVLGSTALAVVALAEYQRATGDTRYLDMATRLSAFMLMMQRPDGTFRHVFDLKTMQPSEKEKLLYFSGEATLALARMYVVTGDERYAVAAEKGLDQLVAAYDSLMGGFIYGEEHWTCITAEALTPWVMKQSYLDFCNGLARFWGQVQPWPGDLPDQWDLAGAHMVTPFLMPQNTPAGSHSEASISTYLLGRRMGRPQPWLRTQILATLHYLLRQQIREDNDYAVVAIAKGRGGVPANPTDRTVRIDFVQHVCSAMLRGVELAREVTRTPAYP